MLASLAVAPPEIEMQLFRPGRLRRGFTLVEIMIVILIIGMLLTIAIPGFMRARAGAQARTCGNNLKQIVSAKERWAMDNQRGANDEPALDDLWGPGKFIKDKPRCPSDGVYTVNPLHTEPTCSVGGTRGEFDAHVLP